MMQKEIDDLEDGILKMKLQQRLAYYYALLLSTPKLATFHYSLLKIALRGIGILNYYDGHVSGENYLASKILPQLIQNKTPVLFDVGANRGDYTLLLASIFHNASIYAFEPHPKNYQILSKLNLQNFFPFNLALSDTIGTTLLYDYAGVGGTTKATLHQGVFKDILHEDANSCNVQVSTLDSIVKSLKIDIIDFLKIDTEGNELSILAGGRELLQQERISAIQFEFNEMNVVSRSLFYDFRKMLENYSLFRLLPKGLLPLPHDPLYTELFAYQNILAVIKSKTFLLA